MACHGQISRRSSCKARAEGLTSSCLTRTSFSLSLRHFVTVYRRVSSSSLFIFLNRSDLEKLLLVSSSSPVAPSPDSKTHNSLPACNLHIISLVGFASPRCLLLLPMYRQKHVNIIPLTLTHWTWTCPSVIDAYYTLLDIQPPSCHFASFCSFAA